MKRNIINETRLNHIINESINKALIQEYKLNRIINESIKKVLVNESNPISNWWDKLWNPNQTNNNTQKRKRKNIKEPFNYNGKYDKRNYQDNIKVNYNDIYNRHFLPQQHQHP